MEIATRNGFLCVQRFTRLGMEKRYDKRERNKGE